MRKKKPTKPRREKDGLYILLSIGIVFPWLIWMILQTPPLLPIWSI